MRLDGWLRLTALCVLAGSLSAASAPAQPQPPRPAAGPKNPLIKEEFTGYGKTVKEAQADALAHACGWLEEHGGLGWSPDADYLRNHNMVEFVGEPAEEQFEHAGPMKVVKMKLEIAADQARAIQKRAQQERMKDRQKYSLLGLIGAVCLIGVVGGYLRLEEATKGYYTRLLRLAAVGLLVVVALGLLVVVA